MEPRMSVVKKIEIHVYRNPSGIPKPQQEMETETGGGGKK